MGYFTRSSSRRANSQPAEPAKTAKPNKLQKTNPRQTRAETTAPGNAPVIENAQPLQTAWEEPSRARARPTWANPDSYCTPRENACLNTMKPIGQYPTAGDYKSVGLTPPTKGAAKRVAKLTVRAVDEFGDALFADTSTPITPVAEDATSLDEPRVKDDEESAVENLVALNGSVEDVVVEEVVGGADVDDVVGTNMATPVSEAIGFQPAHSSLSPVETPVDSPADETLIDPVLTAPDAEDKPLHKARLPAITTDMDAMASENEKPLDRDFIALLNSLPVPKSSRYDVTQLKRVVEFAISHSHDIGDDDVALSLVYYWSDISSDDFKLSLIHNIGRADTDHSLELALKTMLRHSVEDATEWYKAYSTKHPAALTRHDSGSDSSLSSAKSLEIEPLGRTFKVADIYRDTSGPRLEELFMTGKTNTAPLKRPKKPCRVNENSFKRRREWEADLTLDETLHEKRTRLAQEVEPVEAMAQNSSVRARRGQPDGIQQPYTLGQTADLTDAEEITPSVETASVPTPSRMQRGARGRGRGRSRGGLVKLIQPARNQQAESPNIPTQVLGKRIRELSLDTTVSAESTLSNECYSERENEWHGDFTRRQMPNSMYVMPSIWDMIDEDPLTLTFNPFYSEPPENSDNCYECDRGGSLLCCDTCENAFHFKCLRPVVDPKNPPQDRILPPTEIKEYFIGVGEGVQFDPTNEKDLKNQRFYRSVPHIPRLTKPAKPGAETPAYHDANLLKLMENGHVILCNKCGRSSDGERPIIRCDYCPARFHLDCLDPPRANPPNPHVGWMCPNHVRPDDMVVTKMVDGRLQERRVRRPKHTVASVDVEPIPYDDAHETTFDDDFREKRHLLPAGDLVLDFISAVHNDSGRQQKAFFAGLANTCINLARNMVEERLQENSSISANEITAKLAPSINEAIDNLQTGKMTKDQYDAALTLVGFAKAEKIPTVGDNDATISSHPNESSAKSDDPPVVAPLEVSPPSILTGDTETVAAAPSPAIKAGTDPKEPVISIPRHTSPPLSRKNPKSPRTRSRAFRVSQAAVSDNEFITRSTPKSTRKSKRSRAASEAPVEDKERAQKRRHTDSD
ncbi:uncharacterized protein N7482_006623 [Penicillium canariense]|uniref:PHD-type domain-containing protein n=1 Tax=Penicillium canariense TaxID=189055 RepID=A0A9W9LJB8_9EURO|nr:uncharacterized protein N7482_006623 [Penicillium canariense]KAJ5159619.1 hypothetical protein N7482_006623 [Penicillium canariense]